MIKQETKGKYKVVVECGIVNGKRKRICRRITGTKEDAKLLESELIKKVKKGQVIDSKTINVSELADIFLDDYCSKNLKMNTISNYNYLLIKVREKLGSIPIANINPYNLQKFYNDLLDDGLSTNTVRHYYMLINNILEHAVKWRFIDTNPNKYVETFKKEKRTVKVYNAEQIKQLLIVLKSEPIYYSAPIILCIDTGMRREELNGLKWQDIDFENICITVNRVRLAVNGKIIIETPKTVSSHRTIKITQVALDALLELKKNQESQKQLLKNMWYNSDYVFVNSEGMPFYPDTLSKIFKKILQKYNLPPLTLHQLRHTNASLLIQSKQDIKNVSARLGHSSISTTLDIYTHAVENAQNDIVNKLNDILKL